MGRMYYESYKVEVSSRKHPITFGKLLMYDMEDIAKMFDLSINTVFSNLNGVEEDGVVRYKATPSVETKLWSGMTLARLIRNGAFFNAVPFNTIFYKNLPLNDRRVLFQNTKSKGYRWDSRNTKYDNIRKISELKETTVTIKEAW